MALKPAEPNTQLDLENIIKSARSQSLAIKRFGRKHRPLTLFNYPVAEISEAMNIIHFKLRTSINQYPNLDIAKYSEREIVEVNDEDTTQMISCFEEEYCEIFNELFSFYDFSFGDSYKQVRSHIEWNSPEDREGTNTPEYELFHTIKLDVEHRPFLMECMDDIYSILDKRSEGQPHRYLLSRINCVEIENLFHFRVKDLEDYNNVPFDARKTGTPLIYFSHRHYLEVTEILKDYALKFNERLGLKIKS